MSLFGNKKNKNLFRLKDASNIFDICIKYNITIYDILRDNELESINDIKDNMLLIINDRERKINSIEEDVIEARCLVEYLDNKRLNGIIYNDKGYIKISDVAKLIGGKSLYDRRKNIMYLKKKEEDVVPFSDGEGVNDYGIDIS